jgi:hypothetical protein
MREIVDAGLLRALVVDPEGSVYTFDAEGKARINPASPLFKEQSINQKTL